MLWGMFKKVVIAHRLAVATDMVFNVPYHHSAVATTIAAVLFTFQIFCDFSGYSDIAIGSARVMGYDLMKNFDRPYSALTIGDFWRKWHISLSTWFRDYVYIPLGGNRVSPSRRELNLFIVFLLSGLWHGADWKFIIWGALHGVYLVVGNVTRKARLRIREQLGITRVPWLDRGLQQATTFVLVTVAWVFFRANNTAQALHMLGQLAYLPGELATMAKSGLWTYGIAIAPRRLVLCVLVIMIMECVHMLQRHHNVVLLVEQRPRVIRWGIYYALIFAILYLGMFTSREFIYFQF
jgi:D-alanyl-lipoteichoic acid acyltransferase DltB (MBOAT superfamily)